VYIRNNKLAEAEALVHQVNEAELRIFGPDNPRILCHEQTLGEIRERMPDLHGAEAHYRSALANAARLNAEKSTPACIVRSNLAMLLVDAGRNDEAQALLEEQILYADPDSALTKWCFFHAKSLLGETRMARGQFAEAEPLLKEGVDGLRTTSLVAPRRRRRAIEQLARCYDQLNMASPGAGFDMKATHCRKQLAP
jgi:tetratricopeptide (TPR) repeat protein